MNQIKIDVERLSEVAEQRKHQMEEESKSNDACFEETIRANMDYMSTEVQSQIADKLERAAKIYGKLQIEFTIMQPHVLSPKVFHVGSEFNKRMKAFCEENRIICELTVKKELYKDPIKVRVQVVTGENAKGCYKISRE